MKILTPPVVLLSASEFDDDAVLISGRVDGGLAGEEVKILIYHPIDNSIIYEQTMRSSLHAQFEDYIDSYSAEALFGNRTYKIVVLHIPTGASSETSLSYLNPDAANTTDDNQDSEDNANIEENDDTTDTSLDESSSNSEQPTDSDDNDDRSERPSTNGDDEPDDEPVPDDIPVGTVISPFIFKNETTVAPPLTNSAEQPQENIDILTINGTLASFQFTKEMQLNILSGNWSMAMNDTSIF
ncbi:MAG TPA: hypothetical protein VD736_10375 [Nitrososphaera sp.]|nr:hypothetical protein [Nitrososphaera sp.]